MTLVTASSLSGSGKPRQLWFLVPMIPCSPFGFNQICLRFRPDYVSSLTSVMWRLRKAIGQNECHRWPGPKRLENEEN